MSRVSRRSGTKALVCTECVRQVQGKNSRNVGSFRGRTMARLNRHIQEVHRAPRTVKPKLEDAA